MIALATYAAQRQSDGTVVVALLIAALVISCAWLLIGDRRRR